MSYATYSLMNTEIISGNHSLKTLPGKLKDLRVSKPLVVTDMSLVGTDTFKILSDILTEGGISYTVYSDIESDPFDYMVADGVSSLKNNQCDCVIAFGGGSSIDCGKGISIMSVHEGNIIQYGRSTPGHLDFKGPGCPIISIPTTSGTGSEVSKYAIITNHENHQKRSIGSPYLFSKLVFLDPQVAASMPAGVTAYTGIDALCHAIEAYTHKTAIENSVEISDALALRAIEIISGSLLTAYNEPDNIDARFQMQWGALLAGVALNIGAAEAHGIGTFLSKYHHVSHGVSVGIPLPYTMEYNIPFCPERFYNIARAMNKATSKTDIQTGAAMAPAAVKELLQALHFPTLKDCCNSFDEIEKWCAEACMNSCCTSNERLTDENEMKIVMKNCYDQILKV